MWSAKDAIRARRNAAGFSLSDLAGRLQVTKSYMSLIETGKRQPTTEQADALAVLLGLPAELLLMSAGRLPADVQTAIQTDPAEVTTALRAWTDQSAVIKQTEPVSTPKSRQGKSRSPLNRSDVPPALITVSKASTSYRAHSYHTKVPPAAIVPFIKAFTYPGEVVLDSFCGSGMTGVAALQVGRNALLSDLSPAAVHIARNYTTPCEPHAFENALRAVAAAVRPTMTWLYTPLQKPSRVVEYTTWSDVFACARCGSDIVYWQVFASRINDRITCPHCGAGALKAEMRWIREEPVQTHVATGSGRVSAHEPTAAERALIAEIGSAPIAQWTPSARFGSDREMWRASHGAMGIKDATDFYTRRNLHALAAIRHAILAQADARVREALLFAFTACVNRASRRYQWNEKRPTNVMTGTLYVSSLRYEWNVWSLFRRKAADALRYYQNFPASPAKVDVYQRSATDLSCLPDRSIDMAFVDPPFGSNIFYADSSLLWDAWLGLETDQNAEIVVNQRRSSLIGGKNIAAYGGLLADSFREIGRVLRRGGRVVLAFSNSDDRVWSAVQDAISDAGMDVSSVHVLDKGQPSIKGVKGQLGKENVTRLDLALCLTHKSRVTTGFRVPATPAFIDASVSHALTEGYTRNDQIYSAVLRDALRANLAVTGITMPAIDKRRQALSANQAAGGVYAEPSPERDFITGYLSNEKKLPKSDGSKAASKPPSQRTVPGSRNTAYYLAHSYHTKVPPEAIQPFLEHFTKPGDVVLDPFCGSGMTGVAAALSGRKAILSDLSPAAVHLAWNHTRPCDPKGLAQEFARIDGAVRKKFASLYATKDELGRGALIRWSLWSTRHRCPKCSHTFALWDTMERSTGRLARSTQCPECLTEADRRRFETVGNAPAWIAFTRQDGSLGEKAADAIDIKRALGAERDDNLWWPKTQLGPDREMYQRCALHLQGVHAVADLYTPRNLTALAILWDEIQRTPNDRVKRALAFAFTNTAWHGTRMRRFNARGGHRPLTGTLYVPQLSSEANVLEVMRKKVGQLSKYYSTFQSKADASPSVLLGSATSLPAVASNSIDYVFTDPPFGSNIFYADCNLVWESWLGRITERAFEAVVNKSLAESDGGKSLTEYERLMTLAMKEMARVLKPGGWATVVFHNTDAAVWRSIRDASVAAGFEFHEAASLDRKQQSHKGYKGRDGHEDVAHFDIVMNLRKAAEGAPRHHARRGTQALDIAALVETALAQPGVAARGVQGIHAEILRRLASAGGDQFPEFDDVRAAYKHVSKRLDSTTA